MTFTADIDRSAVPGVGRSLIAVTVNAAARFRCRNIRGISVVNTGHGQEIGRVGPGAVLMDRGRFDRLAPVTTVFGVLPIGVAEVTGVVALRDGSVTGDDRVHVHLMGAGTVRPGTGNNCRVIRPGGVGEAVAVTVAA